VRFNENKIEIDELLGTTTRLGFQNVIDAFHRVGTADIPVRFFSDQRKSSQPSVVITDHLFSFASESASTALQETESRWRLVETAWELGTTTAVIGFDQETGNLILPAKLKRKPITSARPTLNGYQKGVCFYCYQKIGIVAGEQNLADVDHLFPHALEKNGLAKNLDGIWNLVLACQICNRGAKGKFDSTPHPKYVERLHKRNEYLILSHHPLRETLIKQSGQSTQSRHQFLQAHLDVASSYQPVPWETKPLGLAAF
jgi:5-methylcytosine-specific restriction endonuclease McrA